MERIAKRPIEREVSTNAAGAWIGARTYHWERGLLHENWPSDEYWLIVDLSPENRKYYSPPRGPALLNAFIRLGDFSGAAQREAICAHAARYGHLGEVGAPTRDGVPFMGEPLSMWQYDISVLAGVSDLIDLCRDLGAQERAPSPELARRVRLDGREVVVDLAVDGSVTWTSGSAPGLRALQQRGVGHTDHAVLSAAVRYVLRLYLTLQLDQRCSAAVSASDGPGILFFASTLRAAMCLQLLRRVVAVSTATQQQCPQCGDWFIRRTRRQKYCSANCRELWWYHHTPAKKERKR